MFLRLTIAASILMALTVAGHPAWAGACNTGSMFNPITDIAWNGIFPIRIAGVQVSASSDPSIPDGSSGTTSPVCICTNSRETFLGLEVDFWDIAYMVEVVKTAYCSPTLGVNLGGAGGLGSSSLLSASNGTNDHTTSHPNTFYHAHWLMFPAFKILGMMLDSVCLNNEDFAFGALSELDPVYNNDLLADLADPKVLLVANPIAALAAMPSYAMAQFPNGAFAPAYDAFFWAWFDNIYPLTGGLQRAHALTSSANIAARQIYTYTELGGVLDYTKNVCSGQYQPIPKKSQWRFQMAKPVKLALPIIAGKSEMIWGPGANPPYHDNDFLWILFQKKRCCQKFKGT